MQSKCKGYKVQISLEFNILLLQNDNVKSLFYERTASVESVEAILRLDAFWVFSCGPSVVRKT